MGKRQTREDKLETRLEAELTPQWLKVTVSMIGSVLVTHNGYDRFPHGARGEMSCREIRVFKYDSLWGQVGQSSAQRLRRVLKRLTALESPCSEAAAAPTIALTPTRKTPRYSTRGYWVEATITVSVGYRLQDLSPAHREQLKAWCRETESTWNGRGPAWKPEEGAWVHSEEPVVYGDRFACHLVPNGSHFKRPRDRFERHYNMRLDHGDWMPRDRVFRPEEDWPLPTRALFVSPPRDRLELEDWMREFLDMSARHVFLWSGNTDAELELLEKRLYRHAAALGLALNERQRGRAAYLGVRLGPG